MKRVNIGFKCSLERQEQPVRAPMKSLHIPEEKHRQREVLSGHLIILLSPTSIGWTAVIYPELVQQTASLQLCGVLVGDAEVPASKDLVAEALEAIRILNQVPFESRGRPGRTASIRL